MPLGSVAVFRTCLRLKQQQTCVPCESRLDPDLSTEGLSQADGNKLRGTWDDKHRNKRVTRAASEGLNHRSPQTEGLSLQQTRNPNQKLVQREQLLGSLKFTFMTKQWPTNTHQDLACVSRGQGTICISRRSNDSSSDAVNTWFMHQASFCRVFIKNTNCWKICAACSFQNTLRKWSEGAARRQTGPLWMREASFC